MICVCVCACVRYKIASEITSLLVPFIVFHNIPFSYVQQITIYVYDAPLLAKSINYTVKRIIPVVRHSKCKPAQMRAKKNKWSSDRPLFMFLHPDNAKMLIHRSAFLFCGLFFFKRIWYDDRLRWPMIPMGQFNLTVSIGLGHGQHFDIFMVFKIEYLSWFVLDCIWLRCGNV